MFTCELFFFYFDHYHYSRVIRSVCPECTGPAPEHEQRTRVSWKYTPGTVFWRVHSGCNDYLRVHNPGKITHASRVLRCLFQVAVLKSDGKTLEAGSWVTAESAGQDPSLQPQNVVTYHVTENGETLVQEALTQEEAAEGEQEFAQIAISAYETAREFSVVEQSAEEIHNTATTYRY